MFLVRVGISIEGCISPTMSTGEGYRRPQGSLTSGIHDPSDDLSPVCESRSACDFAVSASQQMLAVAHHDNTFPVGPYYGEGTGEADMTRSNSLDMLSGRSCVSNTQNPQSAMQSECLATQAGLTLLHGELALNPNRMNKG